MTVRELIEALSAFGPDLPVVHLDQNCPEPFGEVSEARAATLDEAPFGYRLASMRLGEAAGRLGVPVVVIE